MTSEAEKKSAIRNDLRIKSDPVTHAQDIIFNKGKKHVLILKGGKRREFRRTEPVTIGIVGIPVSVWLQERLFEGSRSLVTRGKYDIMARVEGEDSSVRLFEVKPMCADPTDEEKDQAHKASVVLSIIGEGLTSNKDFGVVKPIDP